MATNATTHRSNRKTGATRDRRRDQVVNTIKERPYAAAALATVAAGAAAFLLTRGKSDKPLVNWGQDDTSPSAAQAATLAETASPTSASAAGGASPLASTGGKATTTTGIDDTSKTETKVGAVAYGA